MGRTVEYPNKHIVSFRISDPERETLEEWSYKSGMSVSSLMRTVFSRVQDSFNDILREELEQSSVANFKEEEQR